MNNFQKNLKIQNFQELTQPQIEQKLILLKKEKQNKIKIKKTLSFNNTISKLSKNNYSPYYSNVIISQNNNSPNHSVLLHEFVDDKKVTYKDITNRIDINELSSKIKNIIINTQRIKSCDKIKVNSINNKKQKPAIIYRRKTKSNFSYRQSNSSFTTTENESKYSCSVKNIFVNKNISNRNINIPKYNDTITINLNLNNYLKTKCNNIENKTYENEKFYSKTLREYLNEQVNSIKCKRYKLNENNLSKFNDDDHNYSIDNDNKDLLSNNDNISSDIDNLFILTKTKDENNINTENKENEKEKILKDELDNKNKNICKIKTKNLEQKINYINNHKISTYLSFKQNNINRNDKNKIKKKENNTFRNSHINLNITKQKTMKTLNNNINNYNIKTKKTQTQYINCSKLNNYIQSKPLKINSKINNKIVINQNCKSFSILNNEKNENHIVNNENINNINICRINNNSHKNKKKEIYLNKNKIQQNIDKVIIKRTYENKDKRYKKRKNYSEIIRNKIHSTSQKKIQVKINNNKKI